MGRTHGVFFAYTCEGWLVIMVMIDWCLRVGSSGWGRGRAMWGKALPSSGSYYGEPRA